MHCVVTAGPTYEPLDDVRRLTNFSTGRLGTELANHLSRKGHQVTLLLGESATYRAATGVQDLQIFSTTQDLFEKLSELSKTGVDAIFHASAVSDYTFGRIWVRSSSGEMVDVRSGKISTKDGVLLAELIPTRKIIPQLRDLYPGAVIVGWKYEVEGGREEVLGLAAKQLNDCKTTACVANGKAYGPGFGILMADGSNKHFEDVAGLYSGLEQLLTPIND